jgi:hypothetical protein
MPGSLQDGVRILAIEKDRDLIEQLTAEIPEWAMKQADVEAKRLSEEEERFEAAEHQISAGRKIDSFRLSSETDEEENSLIGAELFLDIADDEEFSRALAALVLRNVNGPDSVGFLSDKNIKEIADILRLDVDETNQLLSIEDAKQLYMKTLECLTSALVGPNSGI